MAHAIELALDLIAKPQRCLSPSEALTLLACPDSDLQAGAALLSRHFQPRRAACAIVSAKTGRCSEDCIFCAQSRRQTDAIASHGLLEPRAMLCKAQAAEMAGAERFGIVTSGLRLAAAEFSQVIEAVVLLRARTGLQICASLGLLDTRQAQELKAAGLTRYHHNLETSASFFKQICTTHAYGQDLTTVQAAQAAGLKTCCGGLFGLGESWNQRLELGLTLHELAVDAIPVNFLNPRPGTPLAGRPLLPAIEALRILALLRYLNPSSELIVAGGRPLVLGAVQDQLFDWGANGLMIGDYLTTRGADLQCDRRLLGLK